MLTAALNIAVFAAFYSLIGVGLHPNAEFKRVCRLWQLDIACYGRQKRQGSWQKWQRSRQKWQRWQRGWQRAYPPTPFPERAGTAGRGVVTMAEEVTHVSSLARVPGVIPRCGGGERANGQRTPI